MSIRRSRGAAVFLVTLAVFTDILAYSIAVPVLPDLSQRFGASPTTIGLLFASFGVTLFAASVPMGAISDRVGRQGPLVAALLVLAASSILFAYATRLSWLFAARLVQGAADAAAWVVGFALVADLYAAEERGRAMGLVMSGSTFGFMIGPTLGGWLYEAGGITTPYLAIAGLSLVIAVGIAALRLPPVARTSEPLPLRDMLRVPAVALCALAVVVGGGTIAMLEPVLALFLTTSAGLGPSRIGMVFGAGASVAAVLHPVFGRVAGAWGGRTLTLRGMVAIGLVLPLFPLITGFGSAVAIYVVGAIAIATFVTPSLSYMAEALSAAGSQSFGVAYGVYNVAWALGLLLGPALGGFLYERVAFGPLTIGWATVVVVLSLMLARLASPARG